MIAAIWKALVNHRAKATIFAYLVFTSFVHTLPMPLSHHSFYAWFYAFLHDLAGGLLAHDGGGFIR